jgi:hypothetical protein
MIRGNWASLVLALGYGGAIVLALARELTRVNQLHRWMPT